MSGHEKNPPEPRLTTLRLARAIGARLRTPLDDARRDALVATLVDARSGAATSGAATSGAAPSGDELAARRRTRGGASLRRVAAAAAALVVIGGAVGVAVRSSDDLPVIVLASGAQTMGSGALDAGARGGSEMALAADAPRIGLWIPTVHSFELADGVTVGVGRAPAWRMVPPADLVAAATRLATALGLPAPGPAEWDPTALVAQDAGGANLWVSAGGDWYYGGPSDLWPMWDCPAVPYDGDGGAGTDASDGSGAEPGRDVPVECTAPEPPAGVPSADRARTLALEHLARLGVGEVRILDVYRDEWGASVQAELVIPGSPLSSGLFVGVGFAGEERLAWANATLARPERLGDYPLLGLAAALERLEQEMNAWLEDGLVPMPRPLPADITGEGDAPVSDGDAPASDPDAPVSDRDAPVTTLPAPGLPGADGSPDGWSAVDQEPIERTVRIVAVELVMSVVWSAGDVQVLLPHYRLIDEDGGWWFVIALEDRHLDR